MHLGIYNTHQDSSWPVDSGYHQSGVPQGVLLTGVALQLLQMFPAATPLWAITVTYVLQLSEPLELLHYSGTHKLAKRNLVVYRDGLFSKHTHHAIHSITKYECESLFICNNLFINIATRIFR